MSQWAPDRRSAQSVNHSAQLIFASALHAVMHEDGAIDAEYNDTHIFSHQVERHALQTAGECTKLACLSTLSPSVRAESVHVRNGSGALHTVTPDDGANVAENNDTHAVSHQVEGHLLHWRVRVTKLSAMSVAPLGEIHRLASLHTLEAQAERPPP